MGTIVLTVLLAVGAAFTAGFWLNILLWIPLQLVSQMQDQLLAYRVISLLAMAVGTVGVTLFGMILLGLPWFAALIAGVFVGITSYAAPN
ncbi:MAG: hypothetical protein WCH97_05680 [Actinomycetes bacterium]